MLTIEKNPKMLSKSIYLIRHFSKIIQAIDDPTNPEDTSEKPVL
jgi:hypothetical protein